MVLKSWQWTAALSSALPMACLALNAFDEANKRSVSILNQLPRYEDCDAISEDIPCSDDLNPVAIATAGVVFGVLAVLAVVSCPVWCCFRWCKCCCCKRTEHEKPISSIKRWCPFLFIALCSALIVSFVGIAYDANQRFSDAIVAEDGLLDIGSDLFSDVADFTQNTVLDPLDWIMSYTIYAINNISQTLEGNTDVIVLGVSELDQEFVDFGNKWSNYSIVITASNGQNITFPCGVCSEIGSVVDETRSKMNDVTQPLLTGFNDTVNEVNGQMVKINSSLVSSIRSVVSQIDSVNDKLVDIQTDYEEDYRDDVETYNGYREQAYLALFAVALVPLIFMVLGGVCRKGVCFTLAYSLSWFIFFLMNFMLLIHMPVSSGLNDSCEYLDDRDDDMQDVFGNDTGKLVQSCLDNTSVAEAFGVDSDLEFSSIDFGDVDTTEITDALTFDGLDGFLGNVSSADALSTFSQTVDDLLSAVNTLVANCTCTADSSVSEDVYNRTSIYDLDSTKAADYYNPNSIYSVEVDLYETLNQTAHLTRVSIDAENSATAEFDAAMDELQSDSEAIGNATENLKTAVLDFFSLYELIERLLQPLFDEANRLIEEAKCGLVGRAYYRFKDAMCEDILASLSTMVLCMLLISIFSFVNCCLSIKMVRLVNPLYSYECEQRMKGAPPPGQVMQPQVILVTGNQPYQPSAAYVREK